MITTAVALVIGVAGILAGRAWLHAIDRGGQKREVADMRSIAASLDDYRKENGGYPAVDSIEALASALSPKYIKTLPTRDNWSQAFHYRSDGTSYTLYSVGKDGYGSDCAPGVTTELKDETCIVDGRFVRYPRWVDAAGGANPR